MKKLITVLLCLMMSLTLVSCGSGSPDVDSLSGRLDQLSGSSGNKKEEKKEEYHEPLIAKDIDSFYNGDESSKTEAAKRYDEAALKIFMNSIEKGDNEIFSPLSLYYCLGMLNNGSAGDSRKELETYLGMSTDDVNRFLKDYYDSTRSKNEWAEDIFFLGNALYFDSSRGRLEESFLSDVQKYYGDVAKERDFKNNKEIADEVNKWVEENTNGGIRELVESNDINKDTYALIVNALACGSEWFIKFDKSKTFMEEFTGYDGSKVNADMMHQRLNGQWNVNNGKGFTKWLHNDVTFVALLPDRGVDIYDFLSGLKGEDFDQPIYIWDVTGEWKESGQKNEWGEPCFVVDRYFTDISFPKFSYEKEYNLENSLRRGGLSNLFDSKKCNFSNMTSMPFAIQQVKQKALVEVDEDHAYAAAATVVQTGLGADGPCVIYNDIVEDLKFDRPFVYAFVYQGVILFMGLVNNVEPGTSTAVKPMKIENYGAGKLNVRDTNSTSGTVKRQLSKGDVVYAYKKVQNEGYTWYQIGDNEWIADKNGEWIREIND